IVVNLLITKGRCADGSEFHGDRDVFRILLGYDVGGGDGGNRVVLDLNTEVMERRCSWLIGVGAQPCSRVWESACGVQLGSQNSSFTDQFVELSCEISALLGEVA
ncbi:hypothetical protein Droror1_Dr00010143, partial [Drosera rotundifolia]